MITQNSLTESSILKARQWFHDNALACIQDILEGKVRVNDQSALIERYTLLAAAYLTGSIDHTLAFRQHAYYIQTGECYPLLP